MGGVTLLALVPSVPPSFGSGLNGHGRVSLLLIVLLMVAGRIADRWCLLALTPLVWPCWQPSEQDAKP